MVESGFTLCPECRNGKHPNCTEQTLSEQDTMVDCACSVCNGIGWEEPDTIVGSLLSDRDYFQGPV